MSKKYYSFVDLYILQEIHFRKQAARNPSKDRQRSATPNGGDHHPVDTDDNHAE
jgi:hypothetical protein